MKKRIITTIISLLFVLAPILMFAQTPPHPNGGEDPNTGGNTPVGGAAPIDGGLSIMLVLGAAYGAKKVYQFKK